MSIHVCQRDTSLLHSTPCSWISSFSPPSHRTLAHREGTDRAEQFDRRLGNLMGPAKKPSKSSVSYNGAVKKIVISDFI